MFAWLKKRWGRLWGEKVKVEIKINRVSPKRANSIVIRNKEEGGIGFESVYPLIGYPERNYEGKYFCLLQSSSAFSVYEPSDEIKMLPNKLFRALEPEAIKRLLEYRSKLLDKLNLGLFVIFMCVTGFLCWMMIAG